MIFCMTDVRVDLDKHIFSESRYGQSVSLKRKKEQEDSKDGEKRNDRKSDDTD